ncbi:hypothetical protein [Microcoleus sp. S11D4]|uniref:hypothetical protein n=1 Tax=Microcoleus sp. S11D4 TaxID=3055407 RepID=UPI002FD348F9
MLKAESSAGDGSAVSLPDYVVKSRVQPERAVPFPYPIMLLKVAESSAGEGSAVSLLITARLAKY